MVDENYLYCCWCSQKITSQDDGEDQSKNTVQKKDLLAIYFQYIMVEAITSTLFSIFQPSSFLFLYNISNNLSKNSQTFSKI